MAGAGGSGEHGRDREQTCLPDEEAARARNEEGLNIRLVKVAEVLLSIKRPGSTRHLGPQPSSVAELPLLTVRKPKDLPSVDELIESDRGAAVG